MSGMMVNYICGISPDSSALYYMFKLLLYSTQNSEKVNYQSQGE